MLKTREKSIENIYRDFKTISIHLCTKSYIIDLVHVKLLATFLPNERGGSKNQISQIEQYWTVMPAKHIKVYST